MKFPFALLLIPLVTGLQAKTVDIGSQRELFVDDYLIARMSGDVQRTKPPSIGR